MQNTTIQGFKPSTADASISQEMMQNMQNFVNDFEPSFNNSDLAQPGLDLWSTSQAMFLTLVPHDSFDGEECSFSSSRRPVT